MTRASLVLSFLASLLACVPVQPQPPTQGPASAQDSSSTAAEPGGAHDEACRAACTVFDQCGQQRFDRCTGECAGLALERLERFASFSCDELTAVLGGTVGSACTSYGRNDCTPLGPSFTCCGGNEATRTPGQCIDAAVCAAPRY